MTNTLSYKTTQLPVYSTVTYIENKAANVHACIGTEGGKGGGGGVWKRETVTYFTSSLFAQILTPIPHNLVTKDKNTC